MQGPRGGESQKRLWGGGGDDHSVGRPPPPNEFFQNGRQNAGQMALKSSRSYGTGLLQLLAKKMIGSSYIYVGYSRIG